MTTQFRRWTLGIVGSVVLPTALVFTSGAASASEPVAAARTSTAAVQTSATETTAVQASTTQQNARYHWVLVRYFNTRAACERYNRQYNRGHYRYFCRYEWVRHSHHRAWALYWYMPEHHH